MDTNLDIDLSEALDSGVYMLGGNDLDHVEASARRDDFNVHRVDLADCRKPAEVLLRLASAFSLPASHGRDESLLVEYLQRMDAIPSRGHVVVLRHTETLQQADPDELERILDMLEETAGIWASEGVSFFVFSPLAEPVAEA